jgi:hypothetical protein
MRREIFVLGLVMACGTPDEPPPALEAFLPRITPRPHRDPPRQQLAPPVQVPVPPVTPPPRTPPVIPTTCMKIGTVTAMAVRGTSFIACVDVDQDSVPDQCVEWSRANGRVVKMEPAGDLEDGPPAVVTDDKIDDSDDRITQETTSIEVCPEDRTCVKLMPRLTDNATIDSVHGDTTHHNIAVAINDGDSENSHIEFWDIQSGRLRQRMKVGGEREPDITYTYSVKPFGDSIVSVVTRGDNQLSTATLYSVDGTRHASLAGGSRYVDVDQTLVLSPGVIAVFDNAPPNHPYQVFVHSLASGGTLAKFAVRMDDDGDDDAVMMKIDPTTLGVVQWSNELRVDLLDTRNGSDRTFKAPGC